MTKANRKPGFTSAKMGEPRRALDRVFAAAEGPLSMEQLLQRTQHPRKAVKQALWSLLRRDLAHSDGGKPARYQLGPKPVYRSAEIVPARSINIWTLPAYVPPAWHVREDAGRVRA